jgi:putative spermidine/putrescine transport system permease protein
VRVSLISTVLSLLLGYPTAYFMARTQSRMKKVMMIIILFPFLVSAVVRSYGWMVILGTNGLLNQLLQALGIISSPLKILNTETAVIIGMIHLLIPYMILSLVGVLQSIDPNVEYAAYSLGASPAKVFTKVTLPLSLPGILSGCVLVFTMSMTSYVTPKLLGGSKFRMMATMVVQEINVSFDWGAASAISYILLAVILLIQVAVVLATSGYMKRMGGGKNA